jgi:triacylglycerol lipase
LDAGGPIATPTRPAILLVPGWRDDDAILQPLARHFLATGWPRSDVHTLAFTDPLGSNLEHAAEIGAAVARLERSAAHTPDCSPSIAVVAHSMGGLALRWYLAQTPATTVQTAIFLATPHEGTWLAWLGRGPGAAEMRPNSRFLSQLRQSPPPGRVRCISFRAPLDSRLFPARSAWLANSERHTLPVAGHRRILRQPAVFDMIARTLTEPG